MSPEPSPPPPAGPPGQESPGEVPVTNLGEDNPEIRPGDKPDELLVFDHGFVRLDSAMADDLSVINSARVSFAVRKEEMDDKDKGLIRFLMRDRHGTPFEHNSLRFHIRTPIFVAREWFRHRVGCLAGETKVTFVDVDGEDFVRPLVDLWEMWHSTDREAIAGASLRVFDEEAGFFVRSRVVDVIDSGVRPTYRVTLEDGRSIVATDNHPLLSTNGWCEVRELISSHAVLTDGGNRSYEENVRPAQVLLKRRQESLAEASPLQVADVRYEGTERTFDLSVEGPWHNFVANGIVVHNSFNEESARYHKLSDDFYVPSANAVRSQVGKPGAYSFEPVDTDIALETITTFERIYKELFAEYERLIELGVAKELARSLLPFGIYTQFYWTLNARSLMNFLSLRNAEPAQYEIRTYAQAVEKLWAQTMPITHECFVEFGRRAP